MWNNDYMLDAIRNFGGAGRMYTKPEDSQPAPKPAPKLAPKIAWRETGSTAAELAGAAAAAYGCYQIYVPAGWLAAGIFLIVGGVAAGTDR